MTRFLVFVTIVTMPSNASTKYQLQKRQRETESNIDYTVESCFITFVCNMRDPPYCKVTVHGTVLSVRGGLSLSLSFSLFISLPSIGPPHNHQQSCFQANKANRTWPSVSLLESDSSWWRQVMGIPNLLLYSENLKLEKNGKNSLKAQRKRTRLLFKSFSS